MDYKLSHPELWSFYLCAHAGIQGTSRAAKYVVLHDENQFGQNSLQLLMYYLCCVYEKCSRIISIPAPVAFAHDGAAACRHLKLKTLADNEYSCMVDIAPRLQDILFFA